MFGRMLRIRRAQRRQEEDDSNIVVRLVRRVALRIAGMGLMVLFVGHTTLHRHRTISRLLEPLASLLVGIVAFMIFVFRWWDRRSHDD